MIFQSLSPCPSSRNIRAAMMRNTAKSLRALCLLALVAMSGQALAQSSDVVTVSVDVNADATNFYRFKASDFNDSRFLTIQFNNVGGKKGNLIYNGTAVGAQTDRIPYDSVHLLVYYPPETGLDVTDNYERLPFLRRGGACGTGFGCFEFVQINLVAAGTGQLTASGAPTVTAATGTTAYNEDVALTATTTGITEPNTIDTDTLSWAWQDAAAPDTGVPAVGDYEAISGATTATFTPLQAHVGRYVRVCASFTDSHATDPRSDSVCSTGTIITGVNDAPVGADSTVDVSSNVDADSPHDFAELDFPFTDEDPGDEINGIEIITLPGMGTLIVAGDSTVTIAANTTLTRAQLRALAWYPPDNSAPKDAFTTFTYKVISSGGAPNKAANAATLTINLVSPLNATGVPALEYATNITAPTEESPIIANKGTIADADGLPDPFTAAWQWFAADPPAMGSALADDDYREVSGANTDSFTPLQTQVGQFLRVCASFTDAAANMERQCLAITTPVANVNDEPTGRVTIRREDHPTLGHLVSGSVPEDIPLVMADTTNGGTLMDEDGLPTGSGRYTDPGEGISWQTSSDNGATWTEVKWTSDRPGSDEDPYYTADQPQVGGRVRVCLFYIDDFNNPNGGDSSTPATRALATSDRTCSAALRVNNTNDPPVAGEVTFNVPITASEESPFIFHWYQLPWTDADGDQLRRVGPVTVFPVSAGTLLHGGGAPNNQGSNVGGTLRYWPAPDQQPTGANAPAYATFQFQVSDDGMDGDAMFDPADPMDNRTRRNTVSINRGTASFRLVTGEQTAASGAPTVDPAADTTTGYAEDTELTARTAGINEINGINQSSIRWTWQQSGTVSNAAPTADSTTWAAITGATDLRGATSTFTPDQPHVGQYIRVCVSFTDTHPDDPQPEGPLCSAIAQVSNTNDEPDGAPAITANGAPLTAAPTEDLELTAAQGTITDDDGITTFTPTWAWHEGDTFESDFTAIANATAATFTPLQAHVGKFIRACATFNDDDSNSGTACWTSSGVVLNVNDAPDDTGLVISPATPTEDDPITLTLGITDEDGTTNPGFAPVWQSAATAAGTFEDISGATGTTFTPDDAQVGRQLQVCVAYTDDQGTTERPCKNFGAVVNVNDAPEAVDGEVSVPATADADNPYPFRAADFSITDADGDALTHVIITRGPATGTGTLRIGTAALSDSNRRVAIGDVGTINYYPPANAPIRDDYSSITWNAVDDGEGPGGDATANKQSTNNGTIDINITSGVQTAATGAPTVTPAADMNTGYAEDAQLSATTTGITEPNGIDDSTLQWVWQQSPPVNDAAPAADSNTWTDIAGSAPDEGTTTATFTPDQPQVGQYIRVCVRFNDSHPGAEAALTTALCSTPAVVANANDAPTTADNAVSAFTTATANTPYRFKVGDFPFTDDDAGQASGGDLVSISVTLATLGTLRVGNTVLTADNVATEGSDIAVAAISTLTWYPPDDAPDAVTDNYAEFTFTVSDGALSSASERMSINLVAPGPITASGAPTVTPAADMDSGYAEDVQLTANTIGIIEPNTIDETTLQWVWQQAATQTGTWADIEGSAPARGATSTTFTPLQAHVGMHIRVCASFRDLGTDPTTGNPTPAAEGPVCSDPAPVANVNDAPQARDRTIYVSLEADMADPYNFTAADFPFTDEDGDSLASITLASVPDDGTLSNGDDPAAVNDVIEVADLGDLTYYPAAGQEAETGYASFTFNVTDDGDGPAGDAAANKTSTTAATITINLLSPEQQAASGAPGISPTAHAENGYAEDAQLTASISGITEPNGINEDSLQWVWQQAPVPASGDCSRVIHRHPRRHRRHFHPRPTPGRHAHKGLRQLHGLAHRPDHRRPHPGQRGAAVLRLRPGRQCQ